MAETKDVTAQEAKAVQEAREQEISMRPAVDIFEDETGITVHADMPGVSKDGLNLNIDSDSLSIVGNVDITLPENMCAVYADMRSTRYERSFTLSRELDGDNIDASLKDGVLTVRIPKREEHKPRKIEIRTD
jgi:HSP20 family molecular chaperone IbpA